MKRLLRSLMPLLLLLYIVLPLVGGATWLSVAGLPFDVELPSFTFILLFASTLLLVWALPLGVVALYQTVRGLVASKHRSTQRKKTAGSLGFVAAALAVTALGLAVLALVFWVLFSLVADAFPEKQNQFAFALTIVMFFAVPFIGPAIALLVFRKNTAKSHVIANSHRYGGMHRKPSGKLVLGWLLGALVVLGGSLLLPAFM